MNWSHPLQTARRSNSIFIRGCTRPKATKGITTCDQLVPWVELAGQNGQYYGVQRGVNLFELSWEKVSARLQPATAGHARLVLSKQLKQIYTSLYSWRLRQDYNTPCTAGGWDRTTILVEPRCNHTAMKPLCYNYPFIFSSNATNVERDSPLRSCIRLVNWKTIREWYYSRNSSLQ